MRKLLLVGPLAHPALRAVLAVDGRETVLAGRLTGGARAGIDAGGWPVLTEAEGTLPAIEARMTPALARYGEVMGLRVLLHPEGQVLGATPGQGDAPEWDAAHWLPDLAAEIARLILEAPMDRPAGLLARRLPMIGVWAESRMRARGSVPSGGDLVMLRGGDDIRLHGRREPFAGYFAVEEWRLSHRTHAGGFTPEVRREGFVMGDAVVVLPWDPVRDRVLLVEQFRMGPAMRHDPQPWLLEAVAGRVDAGETVEEAARREALEEADLQVRRLFPALHHYPSPGAVTEFLYMFVGIADLPDDSAGVHGLDGETEDIRGHLLDRAELTRMVLAGQISNGPLVMLALWLDREAERLRAEAGD